MPVLTNYIWDNKLSQELRAVIVSLLMHLHIDSKPRTEKIVPIYTKKLLLPELEEKSIDKGKNEVSNTFDFLSKEPTHTKLPMKHDAIVDISKLVSYTKTINQKKQNEINIFGKYEDLNEEANLYDEKSPGLVPKSEIEKEIIEEFIKDDESIYSEINSLKEKILYYLENEVVFKRVTAKHKSLSGIKYEEKDLEVNFDNMLLNMIQLTKKLIQFECFTPLDNTKKVTQTKKMFLGLGRQKEQPILDNFSNLVKALVNILVSESSEIIETKTKSSVNDNNNETKEEKKIKKIEKKQNERISFSKTSRRTSFANIESKGGY